MVSSNVESPMRYAESRIATIPLRTSADAQFLHFERVDYCETRLIFSFVYPRTINSLPGVGNTRNKMIIAQIIDCSFSSCSHRGVFLPLFLSLCLRLSLSLSPLLFISPSPPAPLSLCLFPSSSFLLTRHICMRRVKLT